MIAGRLQWRPRRRGSAVTPRGNVLAAFEFPTGTLFLTEAGTKRRASLHLVHGPRGSRRRSIRAASRCRPSTPEEFAEALRRENRTLKRALTDPRVLSGIGNAYSDEILHRARLSPFKLTAELERRRDRAAPRGRGRGPRGMDRAPRRRGPREVSREGDRLQAGDGGARQVRLTLPGLRGRRCSASCTPTTSATTVPAARPADGCWPIARSRGCSRTTGRAGAGQEAEDEA